MKFKVFGWLIVGCLLYVCPNAMAQFSGDIIGGQPADAKVAGIAEAGAPWLITKGTFSISASGAVTAKVKGLVLPAADGGGVGPVTEVALSLVCDGAIVGTTSSVAISSTGDFKIKGGSITLPSRCVAPSVLIQVAAATSAPGGIPTGAGPFIAISGFTTGSSTDATTPDDDDK